MIKLFTIKKTTNKKRKKKYPYKIKFAAGPNVSVPSQYDFANQFLQKHGCIVTAFYMGVRYLGIKISMNQCLKHLQKTDKEDHINYNLRIVADLINKLGNNNPAVFYKKPSKKKMRKALEEGGMILFTEKEPIHTVVLLWDGRKIKRFSDGRYKNVTLNWEIRKRCGDPWYGGCVVVKK